MSPRDVHTYVEALQAIVSNPALRAAMGEAGHRKAAGYRWDTANQAVLDVYLELAGRGATTARS